MQPTSITQAERNRRAMLAKVRTIWIDGLLNRSLNAEVRIALNLTDRPDAVHLPLNAVVQELHQPPRELLPGAPISGVFDVMGGALLILGAPGAGKTTLLLELLRDLLQRAEQDKVHLIPVLFPLSTWAAERKPLKDWLVDQLNLIYDVPKKIGQTWVDTNEVLPLLDGLDEVAAEHRDACVEAINAYRQDIGGLAPIAVASRSADYEALKERLRLRGAVLVEPLTKKQVDSYLARVGGPLRAVRELVASDPEVMELLDSPLMLSVVTLAFKDTSPESLRAEGTVEEKRGRLWEAYIEGMFARKGMITKYGYQKTLTWLSSLAGQMVQHQQTALFVEHIQHDWLRKSVYRRWYVILDRLGGGMFYGVIYGMIYGLGIGLSQTLVNGIVVAIGLVLTIGIGSSLFGGTVNTWPIRQRDTFQTLFDAVRGFVVTGLIGGLLSGLVSGIIAGLVSGLLQGYIYGILNGIVVSVFIGVILSLFIGLFGGLLGILTGKPGINPRQVITIDQVSWSWAKAFQAGTSGLFYGLLGGLILGPLFGASLALENWNGRFVGAFFLFGWFIGLIGGLLFGMLFGLVGGLRGRNISASEYERPNQGVRRSMKSALRYGLVALLSVALVYGLVYGLIYILFTDLLGSLFKGLFFGLFIGPIYGLAVALALGGYAVQSHYILRYLLYRQGSLPFLDLVPWLDHCVDRLFLRRVGGGYIFIHRMLMEHFAAMTDEDIARIAGEVEEGRGK